MLTCLLPVGWLSGHLLRSFCVFDTSSIPDDAEVTAATLQLYLEDEDTNPLGHEIVLMHSDDRPGQQVDVTDFDRTFYKGGGAPNVKIWAGQEGAKTFVLNSTGCGWISATDSTWFALQSEFDVSPTLPSAGMFAEFYSSLKGGAYRPKLSVTYGTKPSVTTAAASGIGASYVTANATGADPGSGTFSEYGFIYDTDGSDPVDIPHADEKVEASNLADGAFSASLTGLDSSKHYQYRAYVMTSLSTEYGTTAGFDTSAAPDTLTVKTNAPTPVTATGATLKGTIVSDGGDSVTEHGFIWKASSDPLEPAAGGLNNPTGADHYALLGAGSEGQFSHGVTGLSTGSAYMVRAFAQTTGGTDYGGLRVFRTGTVVADTFYAMAGGGALYKQEYWQSDTCPSCTPSNTCSLATTGAVPATSATTTTLKAWSETWGSDPTKHRCYLRRGYEYFDTSSIPAGATILSATLSIYVTDTLDVYSAGMCQAHGFGIYHNASHPTVTDGNPDLQAGDFYINYYAAIAEIAGTDIVTGNPNYPYGEACSVWQTYQYPNKYVGVSINTSCIQKAGISRFCFMKYDPAEYASYAEDSDYITYQTNKGAHPPKLELTYTMPGEGAALPSVNVGGDWKATQTGLINVDGQWRLIEAAKLNVGDSWKDPA